MIAFLAHVFGPLGIIGTLIALVGGVFYAGKKFSVVNEIVKDYLGIDPWSVSVVSKFFGWPWAILVAVMWLPDPWILDIVESVLFIGAFAAWNFWKNRNEAEQQAAAEQDKDDGSEEITS